MDTSDLDKAINDFSIISETDCNCKLYEYESENEKSTLPIFKTESLSGSTYD